MKKNELYDIVYIDHIVDYIIIIEKILQTGNRDFMAELAAIRAIEVIGEAANNLSAILKTRYNDIPWRRMIDMRNLLIHGYFEVEIQDVWDVCNNDIPMLKEQILRIKKEMQNNESH